MTQPDNAWQPLLDSLRDHVVQVNFVKADGSLRIMQATLCEHYLPTQTETQTTPRVSSPQVFKVWDLDNQAWRSFRTESVQSWQIVT